MLLLKDNLFKEVPYKPFVQLGHLNVLDLEDNTGIDDITNKAFEPLTKLTSLNLKGCRIRTLNAYNVDGLDSLKTLDLSNNQFSRIPRDALKQLDRLEELEIGMNYVKEITYEDMSSLRNLKSFSIFGCHRDLNLDIDSNAFQVQPKCTLCFAHHSH